MVGLCTFSNQCSRYCLTVCFGLVTSMPRFSSYSISLSASAASSCVLKYRCLVLPCSRTICATHCLPLRSGRRKMEPVPWARFPRLRFLRSLGCFSSLFILDHLFLCREIGPP